MRCIMQVVSRARFDGPQLVCAAPWLPSSVNPIWFSSGSNEEDNNRQRKQEKIRNKIQPRSYGKILNFSRFFVHLNSIQNTFLLKSNLDMNCYNFAIAPRIIFEVNPISSILISNRTIKGKHSMRQSWLTSGNLNPT